MERKRLEELKIKLEIERKKEERLRKLKAEKDRLAEELNQQENTLRSLKKEIEYERKRKAERQSKDKTEIQQVLKEKDHWKGKLLKPTIPNLTEDTFDELKIEVEVIMNLGLYEESMLRQAVRNSLCGQTRKILLTIPPSTTTKKIISKLENVYGNVRSGESVLAEFYMARQGRDEGIAQWGIRDNRRRDDDRYNRGNGIDRRHGDRYGEYRERRRYSPRDRRNDRTDYLDQVKERRYYRDYRQTNEKDNRDKRRLDDEREHKYHEDYRSPSHRDSGYRREPGEEGSYRYNR
ncbi:uncharacterized protein LOC123549864 [Mercenaria mercenaria]|uniref:uncharacterized protein LOC123549864 n=1 Tax=Mercenaria mercenaria TaxID=6596 RepID=UPI00234E6CD0|nr:uncharacterized protein LOC123549864 [Mercenaria mercenaria]